MQIKPRPRNKFGAIKTEINGVKYDSKKESRRAADLALLERAGQIADLRRQVRFELVPATATERPVFYLADFVYYEISNKRWIVEDVKSPATRAVPAYVIKRKLMKWRHPEYVFVEY